MAHPHDFVSAPFCVGDISEVSHQYEYDNDNEHVINYFSNNQMGLHMQAENANISKKINQIIRLELVWTKLREMTS
jgi:hypothetical protein